MLYVKQKTICHAIKCWYWNVVWYCYFGQTIVCLFINLIIVLNSVFCEPLFFSPSKVFSARKSNFLMVSGIRYPLFYCLGPQVAVLPIETTLHLRMKEQYYVYYLKYKSEWCFPESYTLSNYFSNPLSTTASFLGWQPSCQSFYCGVITLMSVLDAECSLLTKLRQQYMLNEKQGK